MDLALQKSDIQYRKRILEPRDLTLVEGVPDTTLERTIADLIDLKTDLSLVANILASAVQQTQLHHEYLIEILGPLPVRNGFKKTDGQALLDRLLEIAGLNLAAIAKRLIETPQLGESLRNAHTVDETVERMMRDFQMLNIVSPEVVREITATFHRANLFANPGRPVRALVEHYQKIGDALTLPALVGQFQSATALQVSKRRPSREQPDSSSQDDNTEMIDE